MNTPMVVRRFLACRAHLGAPLAVLEKVARAVPPLRGPAAAANAALGRYTDHRGRAFDRRHGTDTFSRVRMDELGLDDDEGRGYDGWKYGPICPDFFHEIARAIPRRDELTLYDVGTGKGLPLLIAGEHGFRRVMGIELSEELCATARVNFARYAASTGRAVDAELVCGDFMKHDLPDEPTAFFLNNPFPDHIAARAMQHIAASLARRPRRVVIAYRRMHLRTLRLLESWPSLRLDLTTPYWQIFSTR